jgi:hypothetical protein
MGSPIRPRRLQLEEILVVSDFFEGARCQRGSGHVAAQLLQAGAVVYLYSPRGVEASPGCNFAKRNERSSWSCKGTDGTTSASIQRPQSTLGIRSTGGKSSRRGRDPTEPA